MLKFTEIDDRLLELAITAASTQTDESSVLASIQSFRRKPLRKWFLLRKIKAELDAEGIVYRGTAIDWDKIGDFLLKIAPIIMEIIKMFL